MISDIAHELRTPLGNIRGWLEAAEDGVADPGMALISSLLEEALQLQSIIDDLRDLAAADAGQFRLRLEPTRLDELLRQVVSAQRARAEAVDVRLTARVPDRAHLGAGLNADPVRLRQAVGNLVANAISHTPPGGEVTVTYMRMGSHFIIEVIDTGSGISAEDLPLIFDRFWRADKSRSRRTGGSGLGLPITRQLVEAHGGHVTAASTPGQGSVFTIWLPGGSPLRITLGPRRRPYRGCTPAAVPGPNPVHHDKWNVLQGYPGLDFGAWSWNHRTGGHALRLVFGGVFDKFPGARIILGHMGEFLPAQLSRLDQCYGYLDPTVQKQLKRLPSEYFGPNIAITTSGVFSHQALTDAITTIGIDNVMFSIDYPYESIAQAAEFMRTAPLSPADKERVAHANAERILRLPSD